MQAKKAAKKAASKRQPAKSAKKSASKRQGATIGKSEIRGGSRDGGRTKGSTEMAVVDLRAEAARLYLAGKSPTEIAAKLDRSEWTIYGYLATVRTQLITEKKAYFDARLAILMDDAFDSLAAHAHLLASPDWLKTAEPERIDTISRAFGIISDKCFVLLAAAGRNRTTQPEQSPA